MIGIILSIVGAVSGNRKEEGHNKIFCRYCGRESSSAGQFCPLCGRNLQAQSTTMKQCINCGSSTSEDSIFCATCGKKFGEANIRQPSEGRFRDAKYVNQNFILRNFKTIIIIEGAMIVVLLVLILIKG